MELVKNEQDARPFQCSWQTCSKRFDRRYDLRRHYQTHTNERPYSCATAGCSKNFIQQSALTVHIRTHTGEKPHQCQHIGCGKRFSDSSGLARHRRIHTNIVKHQRRSHQNFRSEIGDISESTRMMRPETIPQHLVVLDKRQVQSFAGYGQHQDDFCFQNNLSYIPEQNNPRVVTLNADIPPTTQSPDHPFSQNLQSSPSYFAASIASPAPYSLFPTTLIGQVYQQQLSHDLVHLPCWCTRFDCRHVQPASHI